MVFGCTSAYLIVLIVLLRLLSIKRPMKFDTAHKQISRIGCPIIWAYSLIAPTIVVALSTCSFFDPRAAFLAVYQIGGTIPDLLTIIIQTILLWTLRKTTTLSDEVDRRIKLMEKMITGMVIALIIFNVPGHIVYYFNAYYLNERRKTLAMEGKNDTFEADVRV